VRRSCTKLTTKAWTFRATLRRKGAFELADRRE